MAASPFARHYIECDNCAENPAQFLCKTCPGHLCDSCKSEHERRKITQNHDIIHLTSEKGDIQGLLYCTKRKPKKLGLYCSPCEEPICTKCMTKTHNGHEVKNLDRVYNRIKNKLEKEKEEIEITLLPKYKNYLAKERAAKAKITKRTDEVQKQIEVHTEKLIKTLIGIKKSKIQDLGTEEQEALKAVDDRKIEIKRRIKILEDIKTQITCNLIARPSVELFSSTDILHIDYDTLDEMREFPCESNFRMEDFEAGDIDIATLEREFGNLPYFEDGSSSLFFHKR